MIALPYVMLLIVLVITVFSGDIPFLNALFCFFAVLVGSAIGGAVREGLHSGTSTTIVVLIVALPFAVLAYWLAASEWGGPPILYLTVFGFTLTSYHLVVISVIWAFLLRGAKEKPSSEAA
ncbi:hypothetical protein RZ532_08440 [Nitratireductor aquimarinus]|uniref:hypothetical protein n=1 Tax=Nitratireductor aquimarinus TaxID=889300 RepID=UPI0029355EE9|nr:hypothetical protein [Nitratireductor aquimarinus]MDV2966000.1 hypothetical protein [Nitratireductor aquimarinus]